MHIDTKRMLQFITRLNNYHTITMYSIEKGFFQRGVIEDDVKNMAHKTEIHRELKNLILDQAMIGVLSSPWVRSEARKILKTSKAKLRKLRKSKYIDWQFIINFINRVWDIPKSKQ